MGIVTLNPQSCPAVPQPQAAGRPDVEGGMMCSSPGHLEKLLVNYQTGCGRWDLHTPYFYCALLFNSARRGIDNLLQRFAGAPSQTGTEAGLKVGTPA